MGSAYGALIKVQGASMPSISVSSPFKAGKISIYQVESSRPDNTSPSWLLPRTEFVT